MPAGPHRRSTTVFFGVLVVELGDPDGVTAAVQGRLQERLTVSTSSSAAPRYPPGSFDGCVCSPTGRRRSSAHALGAAQWGQLPDGWPASPSWSGDPSSTRYGIVGCSFSRRLHRRIRERRSTPCSRCSCCCSTWPARRSEALKRAIGRCRDEGPVPSGGRPSVLELVDGRARCERARGVLAELRRDAAARPGSRNASSSDRFGALCRGRCTLPRRRPRPG